MTTAYDRTTVLLLILMIAADGSPKLLMPDLADPNFNRRIRTGGYYYYYPILLGITVTTLRRHLGYDSRANPRLISPPLGRVRMTLVLLIDVTQITQAGVGPGRPSA